MRDHGFHILNITNGCLSAQAGQDEGQCLPLGAVEYHQRPKIAVPVRKEGKLPRETVKVNYGLEYGSDVLTIHRDAIKPGQRVLITDDLLATGGTIDATIKLVEELGGVVAGIAFLIELTYLDGREKLNGYDMLTLMQY